MLFLQTRSEWHLGKVTHPVRRREKAQCTGACEKAMPRVFPGRARKARRRDRETPGEAATTGTRGGTRVGWWRLSRVSSRGPRSPAPRSGPGRTPGSPLTTAEGLGAGRRARPTVRIAAAALGGRLSLGATGAGGAITEGLGSGQGPGERKLGPERRRGPGTQGLLSLPLLAEDVHKNPLGEVEHTKPQRKTHNWA